jgi:hypothetical protein
MESTTMNKLNISINWERLEEGPPEERACFGMVTASYGPLLLTEGLDAFVDRGRTGPLVSGYHLAEWFAWNWWRLISEPRPVTPSLEWDMAHRMSTIGSGYLWPNITIFSDRERTVLISKPTHQAGFTPFRFTGSMPIVVSTTQFTSSLESFIGQIQGQLRANSVTSTNLDNIWEDLLAEITDPDTSTSRRLEALLGIDPDEGDFSLVNQLILDASRLGQDAVQEIAADHHGYSVPTAIELESMAKRYGTEMSPKDMVQLPCTQGQLKGSVPGWLRGFEAARSLRAQERLGNSLNNRHLAELVAISDKVLDNSDRAGFAFCLDDDTGNSGSVVLRSKWETGRRFELARILGDRLTNGLNENLTPATRAYTYRQKVQRAFAAELLCPLDALLEQLEGDYSPESREDAAHFFNVSELTVTTILVNHNFLERDYLESDTLEAVGF